MQHCLDIFLLSKFYGFSHEYLEKKKSICLRFGRFEEFTKFRTTYNHFMFRFVFLSTCNSSSLSKSFDFFSKIFGLYNWLKELPTLILVDFKLNHSLIQSLLLE